jgi:hypothetical protein
MDLLFDAFGDMRGVFWGIVESYQRPENPYCAEQWYAIRISQREELCEQLWRWVRPVPNLPNDEIGPLGAMGLGRVVPGSD